MDTLALDISSIYTNIIQKRSWNVEFDTTGKSIEERVKLLILRDLLKVGWNIEFKEDNIGIIPPANYDKATIKHAMSIKRQESIKESYSWIQKNLPYAINNLADGPEVLKSKISPSIEVCETQKQRDLFRILRYYWSSPYSEYVGRRIRLIIRDNALPKRPVIGIAALGSPIIHIPERDKWIGWDKETRTKNLIYTMDAYIVGALPPYNHLLGGKLISYILASNEVRQIYKEKYRDRVTLIKGRTANQLVGIFTTSLYGPSSQYNRLKIRDQLLYYPIGATKGYGTLHLSGETVQAMLDLLKSKQIRVNNNFGDGPSWTMRVIRQTGDLLGFDSDALLRHSFRRNVYFVPLAENSVEFLSGQAKKVHYYNYSLKEVTNYWKGRWFCKRIENPIIINDVLQFKAQNFSLLD